MRLAVFILAVSLAGCDALGGGDHVEVARYAGPEITEADATVDNPPFGPAPWSTFQDDAIIVLSRVTACGDECARTLRLRFEGTGDLPTAVDASVTIIEYLPERTAVDYLDLRRVEVQDWGPSVFSGVAYPEPQAHAATAPIVFWSGRGVAQP